MRINFDHEIDDNPQPEDAATITVTATIFGDDDEFDDMPFTTRSLCIQDFFGGGENENSECQIIQELKCFLEEANIDDDVIGDAMRELVVYIDFVTCSTSSSDYSLGCSLAVQLDLFPDSQSQIEEAIRVSFDETSNNTRFRPANKLVVKSLIRNVYKKKIRKENRKKKKISFEECTICLEEFKNGGRVVPLACGHEFDEECIVKWLETSHVCPLCRYELPCEDQKHLSD
ncbi:hypothetical protein HA466_0289860 [Hirschfeldia incana]|nr:hypothetical protein HA466_0289860 [Hirschfeldia incana]